jgi:VIT1/CCC1 family predicted Fe2+/Mn2+ transporter
MGLMDYIEDVLKSGLRRTLANVRDDVERAISKSLRRTTRRIVMELTGMLLILISVLFLAAAVTFFFIEYLVFTKTVSFLIVGIIILLAGLIIKINNR